MKQIIIIFIAALLFATMQTFAQSTKTTYEYDAMYRLTKVIYSNGVTVSYTYDELGNRTSKTVNGNHLDGDVNVDNIIDAADITAVLRVMSGVSSTVTEAQADVNNDGKVDVGDIITIINKMADK